MSLLQGRGDLWSPCAALRALRMVDDSSGSRCHLAATGTNGRRHRRRVRQERKAHGRIDDLCCLFRHATAQVVRDLVTRMGERVVVQRGSLRVAETVLESIGVKLVRRVTRGGLWRLLPAIGALAVAGYAYYDTDQVGQTAIEFFSKDMELK